MGLGRSKGQQPEACSENMADESLREKAEWKPTTQQLLIMGVLSVISFMVSLDATIIVTSLNAIIEDISGTTTQGIWVGTAYLLSTAVAMPFLASLSNIFGRPLLLMFSVSMFAVGSLVCATSHSIGQLLAGRSVQGTGGGGIVVISLVTFTDMVPLRQRPKWYGTVQGAWALGTCIGPIAGGAIAQNTTWRWVFYLMLPLCGFGLATIPLLLSVRPRVAKTVGQKLRRVDWVGAAAFTASATALLVAISWGGTQFAWSSPATAVPLALGAAGLVATGLWERRCGTNTTGTGTTACEPLLPHALFGSTSAVAVYACTAAQGLLLFGQLYYIPFYLMAARGDSPLRTGVGLLPVMLTLVPASIAAGALITRTGAYRPPIWAGWAAVAVGCGLTTLWGSATPTAARAAALVVLGLGHGAVLNAQNFAAQAISPPGREAHAAAAYALLRHLGTALGVGVGSSAFQNVMAARLRALAVPDAARWAANAEGWLPRLRAMEEELGGGGGDGAAEVLDGYVVGLRGVFRVYLAVSGAALLLSLLVRHCDMNKDLSSEHEVGQNKLSVMLDARRFNRASVLPGGGAADGQGQDAAARDGVRGNGVGKEEAAAAAAAGTREEEEEEQQGVGRTARDSGASSRTEVGSETEEEPGAGLVSPPPRAVSPKKGFTSEVVEVSSDSPPGTAGSHGA